MSKGERRAALGVVRGPADALLLLRVTGVAALVPAAMRLPLPKLTALIRPRRRPRRPAPPGYVERVVAAVDAARIAGYPVVRQGCLTRAVTLYWFLARAGVPVELRFGIARTAEADGHAWLAVDGAAYLEKTDPAPQFTVTYRVPAVAGRP